MIGRTASLALAVLLVSACAQKKIAGPLPPLPAPQGSYAPELAGNPCPPGVAPVLINYATDREQVIKTGKDGTPQLTDKLGNARFSGKRAFVQEADSRPRNDRMVFGHAIVCVDPLHQSGDDKTVKLGLVGGPTARIDGPWSDNAPGATSDTSPEWINRLNAQSSAGGGRVLIYVHGYNNTFEEALLRAARLKQDLGFAGPVIAFSWPSAGKSTAFLTDISNAHFGEAHLRKLLTLLPAESKSVAIIAHSLGNQVVSTMLAATSAKADPGSGLGRISEVIMAAPAVDSDYLRMSVGRAMTGNYPATRFTIYASRRDRAMDAVRSYSGSSNAGDGGDLFYLPPIQTIDTSAIKNGLIGHSYFVDSPAVLADIRAIIDNHAQPFDAKRGLLKEADYVWAFCEPAPVKTKTAKEKAPKPLLSVPACPLVPEPPAPAR
jgi:pimeloyl-ACP methyl ester carboxylesterase